VTAALLQLARAPGGRVAVRRALRDPSAKLFIAQLITAASAFSANILAARAMGPSGRGELALLLQMAYFGSLAVLLGCDRSVVAVYTGQPAGTVTRAFLRLLLRPSAVTVLVLAAVVLPLPVLASWRERLSIAAVFLLVNALCLAIRSIAIAAGRAQDYLVCSLIGEAVRIGGFIALVVLGRATSTDWLLVYVAADVLFGAIWLCRWGRSSKGGDDRSSPGEGGDDPDRQRQRRARREGLALLPATVAHSGTLRVDRLILAGMASTAALGLYATVATIVEMIIWPLLVFSDSRLGVWRQAYDRGDLSLRRVIALAVAYSVVAGALVDVLLHLLLVPVLGPRYVPALHLILPLTAANAVFGISQLLITALTAVRRGALSSLVELVGVGVSVVAYVTLISRFDALGAAYGSLIGYTSCLVMAAALLTRARRARPAAVSALPVSGRPVGEGAS
jgi:O-antigen/teichoic acid export membrane protein